MDIGAIFGRTRVTVSCDQKSLLSQKSSSIHLLKSFIDLQTVTNQPGSRPEQLRRGLVGNYRWAAVTGQQAMKLISSPTRTRPPFECSNCGDIRSQLADQIRGQQGKQHMSVCLSLHTLAMASLSLILKNLFSLIPFFYLATCNVLYQMQITLK